MQFAIAESLGDNGKTCSLFENTSPLISRHPGNCEAREGRLVGFLARIQSYIAV